MIYPSDFESRIGFNRIRKLPPGTVSNPGSEKVMAGVFLTNHDAITVRLDQTSEFQRILVFENDFPSDHFFDLTPMLTRIRMRWCSP
ncbi:MAG: hypothetical protein R2727_05215 [Bacteroidales bacterium]